MRKILVDTVLAIDPKESILIASHQSLTVECEVHGNIHMLEESSLCVVGKIHGSIIADEHTTIRIKPSGVVYGGIDSSGTFTGESGFQVCTNDAALADAMRENRALLDGLIKARPLE